ncbi:MAG: hypothetical protein KF830_16055 [Planctomycetes bacterium]|nr:hypothetical protein [Planctomycetota bacterium]
MTRDSEFSACRSVRLGLLAHLLLAVCLLVIAGPVAALANAGMQVDAERTYDFTVHDYDAVITMGQVHPRNREDGHDAVYDGITHLFAGMVDARADPGCRNAAKGGATTVGAGRTIVTTRGGTSVAIPEGWVARTADNGKGIVYQRPGAQGNADMIRIMDPTSRYPSGYVRYYNQHGQPLDVLGRPAGREATHIPLDYQGPIPGWPK